MAQLIIDEQAIDIPDGTKIAEACEYLGVPMKCDDGECHSCIISILKGEDNLKPMNEVEREFELGYDERLACQAEIRSGVVEATW